MDPVDPVGNDNRREGGFFSSWETLLHQLRLKHLHCTALVPAATVPHTLSNLHLHAACRAPLLLKKHTQEVIRNRSDYYVAFDPSTETYYMCFKHLMMIDIDLEHYLANPKRSVKALFQMLEAHPTECFDVYKSHNGYHIFCVSSPKNYSDPEHLQLMWDLGSDYWYMAWASLRGWSVRLNMKVKEFNAWMVSDQEEARLYRYIGRYGQTKKTNARLLHLVKAHLRWSRRFATSVSLCH